MFIRYLVFVAFFFAVPTGHTHVLLSENFAQQPAAMSVYGVGTAELVPVSGEMSGMAVSLIMPFTEWGQDLGWTLGSGSITGNTSGSLEDYELSFDLYTASSVSRDATMRIRIEGWSAAHFRGEKSGTGEGVLKMPEVGASQRFRFNLGSFLPRGNFDPLSKTWMLVVNFKAWEVGGPGTFNVLIDNVVISRVTSVPSTLK